MRAQFVKVGVPDRTIPRPRAGGRQPELSKCRLHWELRGSVCIAERSYEGA